MKHIFKKKYDVNELYIAAIYQLVDVKYTGNVPYVIRNIKGKFIRIGIFKKVNNDALCDHKYKQLTSGIDFYCGDSYKLEVGDYYINRNTIERLAYKLENSDVKKITKDQIIKLEQNLNAKAKKEETFDA